MPNRLRFLSVLIFGFTCISPNAAFSGQSHFECQEQGKNRYRPYYIQFQKDGSVTDYSKTAKGLLGQNAMPTLKECEDALDAANHTYGVICSRTGLDGWKPTLYTGTRPGRADFGYIGGSSIVKFDDCLRATRNSSKDGVCFWGGSQWYVSQIDREQTKSGPYRSLDECVLQTNRIVPMPFPNPK